MQPCCKGIKHRDFCNGDASNFREWLAARLANEIFSEQFDELLPNFD
jgi:hypothetical protein